MSEREKVHTPRSLAAILNPDVGHAASNGDSVSAELVTVGSATNAASAEAWANLRDRVFRGQGTIELLLFRAGAEVFALPIDSVDEALDEAAFHVLPDMPPNVVGMINMGDRSIPVYEGKNYLGVATTGDRPSVLIVKCGKEDAGLVVDSLMSSATVDVSEIRRVPGLEDSDGILVGVFFFGGELVALLDPSAFARQRQWAEKNEN